METLYLDGFNYKSELWISYFAGKLKLFFHESLLVFSKLNMTPMQIAAHITFSRLCANPNTSESEF